MPKDRAKPARPKGFEPDVKKTKVLYESITTKPKVIVGANRPYPWTKKDVLVPKIK